MGNLKLHPAGLLFLLIIFSLAAGCRGDETGGRLPTEGARQPTVASAPPADAPRPTETPGPPPSTEKLAREPAQTGISETPPDEPAQASPTAQPSDTPFPSATPGQAGRPGPIAYLPTPAPVSAPDGIYDYAAVTTGRAHTCLLRNDGSVRCARGQSIERPPSHRRPSPWSPSARAPTMPAE